MIDTSILMNGRAWILYRAATAIVALALLSTPQPGICQSGPPQPPPIPVGALYFSPLETPPWQSSSGKPAMASTNLNVAPSWDYAGTALSVDTNVPAFLQLYVYQDGRTNVSLTNGSLEIWGQANWTSIADGGTGPGAWATLWDIGSYTRNASMGAWLLAIDPSGSNLVWVAQSGGSNQMLWTPIDFDAGDWHQMVATWSATNACLYVDGELATNTGPILYRPGAAECLADGFCVGSVSASGTNAGTHQFQGQLQWLSSYAFPLSADEVAADFTSVSDYIDSFGYSVPGGGAITGGGGFHTDDSPPDLGGGGFDTNGGGGSVVPATFTPPASISPTNYAEYNQFYLTITNDSTNAYVSVCNTLSNLTYLVYTNDNLATTNWGLWQTLPATHSITPAPTLGIRSNAPLFFNAALVWSTCTTYSPALPDWWAELYFGSTACVDPNANPAGDGIDNWDKYVLGLNPNIAYVSPLQITPPGGSYVTTPAVTIFSLTGASIKYTTNGSIPSATNGQAIASGVSITNLPSGNFTLKAWDSGLTPNVPISASYAIIPATPAFSLASGVYASGTMLQISCVTTNAMVYYTTNGMDPTTNSILVSTNCIALTTNVTVKAAAWLGANISPVAQAEYLISPVVSNSPPPNDNFSNAITLSGASGEFIGTTVGATLEAFESNDENYYFFSAIESGSTVWYKWTAPSNGNVFVDCSKSSSLFAFFPVPYDFRLDNGPDPDNLIPSGYVDSRGGVYYGPYFDMGPDYYFNDDVISSYTLVATQGVTYYFSICFEYGRQAPFDVSWEYVGPSQTPVFSPPGGTYSMPESVRISDPDTNAVIYYTLDGADPTTNGAVIASGGTLTITNSITLKAAAWRAGLNESAVQTAVFTATTNTTLAVSPPILSPANEIFTNSLTITLTCTNAGAIIYYTLDGTMPDGASPSVSSGGTVTISHSAILNATAWVTNMNFSPITTSQYAEWGVDTAGDGIPDSSKLQFGVNILIPEAGNINPNPLAHGLDNLQVYENQSVLMADNYSTENDGVPDWWLVKNGYSVSTPATAIGANGQTLLASYLEGLSPNSPGSLPGQTSLIDFHLVHGPSNSLVMVLDSVRSGMAVYRLTCWNTDQGLPAIMEEFPANESMDDPTPSLGRYFQMTHSVPPGFWYFTLQGVNSNGIVSQISSNTFTYYDDSIDWITGGSPGGPIETFGYWGRSLGTPIPVVGYTNKNTLKEPLLVQRLRQESDVSINGNYFEGANAWSADAILYDDAVPESVTTEASWGTLTFSYSYGDYYATNFASYFTALCSTPDSPSDCGTDYSNSYEGYGYLFPDSELTPLQATLDTNFNSYFLMPEDTFNPAGLAYLSVTYRIGNDTPATLYPGESNTIPTNFSFEAALQTETPTLRTVHYYFDGREYSIVNNGGGGGARSSPPIAPDQILMDGYLLLGSDGGVMVPVSVTNPVIIAQVGKPVHLQSWSQVMAVRPDGELLTNQSYWIDQDFAQAYLCDPGTGDVPRTSQTNYNGNFKIDTDAAIATGILSPNLNYTNVQYFNTYSGSRCADFTPTQPGKVIVTTLPDSDGFYGEVTLYVIDMQVDANHDGLMDNRDLTSVENPMEFWVNNDCDRWHSIDYGTDEEQDDLQTNGMVLDCNYQNGIGQDAIPCTRDLEDYARLWIPGLTNLMQVLPSGYGINLQWRNGTGAGIRIFGAADTNGGTNYLFDGATATNQIDTGWYPCFGYVTSNQSLAVSATAWNNLDGYPPSDHFIFCGTASGNDELVLQVTNQFGGVVGEASVFLNLKDIKQMYERWTVGDDPNTPPTTIAVPAYDGGVASFQYPYDSQTDINTPYILHVHGSNMEPWEKDRFAETMYKRLYWLGYQGRFGSFRWPTASDFNPALDNTAGFFGGIEDTAWLSAAGLKNLLTRLNILYPGQVQLSAHSMGNIVVGEALRQTPTTLVQTYTAFQGNTPAHAYDPNATTLTVSPDVGEPNVYAYYWNATNAQYFAGVIGAARYVNFFNTNDFVLNYWRNYQADKPVSGLGYGYMFSQYYRGIGTGPTIMNFPTNTYEIFAFCQQAKCNCIGEQAGLGGVFLTPFQVDLAGPPYNFGDKHKFHSGEFRSDNMSRAVFWNQVLVDMGLK